MSALITVRLDTSAFEAWTTKATAQLARNLRSAVNTSARTARRATIIAMAADAGVPASRFRKGTPTVSGATTGNLSARWTVSGKGTGDMLRPVGSTTVPAKIGHGKVYVGSTFHQTGGGSDPLSAKAFIVTGRNGNRLVVVRNGKGRGAFKPLYAEGPGTAMRQPNSVDALSGIQSYTAIQRELGVLLDSPKVRGILLDLDTPGGEAAGLVELADWIKAARDEKPIWALANTSACSGGYWIASACSRIVAAPMSSVGSIGVVTMHTDVSKAMDIRLCRTSRKVGCRARDRRSL